MNTEVHCPPDESIIVMKRTLQAPRDVVWTAFTHPSHVTRWYGGHGFSSPRCEMDVRPGGLWRHVMRTPDGTEYDMEFVYLEVVRPERLVWRNNPDRPLLPGTLNVTNTVSLEAAGDVTRWQLVARFDSIALRDAASKMGFSRVIAQGSEKLEAVARELAGQRVAGAAAADTSARSLALGTFVPMLTNLLGVLDKGAEHAKARGYDAGILADARLAPDMFTLRQQVQFACHHAADAHARLTGKEPPPHPSAPDSYAELRGRVEATVAALERGAAAEFEGAEGRDVVMQLPGTEMAFQMSGYAFLRDWAIPHFYFHVVTAYDLLRHNGIDVGKRDYAASVGKYLRRRDATV